MPSFLFKPREKLTWTCQDKTPGTEADFPLHVLGPACCLQAQKSSGPYLPVKLKAAVMRSKYNIRKRKNSVGNPMENFNSPKHFRKNI